MMGLRPVAIVILAALAWPLWSGGVQDSFTAANLLYEEGEYARALTTYRQIETDLDHWKLFYNMGNCHYKLGDPVKAKIYYLKARRLKPLDDSIERNIQIVNSQFKDKLPDEKPDFIARLVLRIESAVSLNLLSVLFLLVLLSLNISVFLLLSGRRHRLVWYAALLFFCLALITGGYHLYRVEKSSRQDLAVVVAPEAQLHSGPGENHTILFKVNPGLDVRIIERSHGWVQVMASPQVAGWIRLDALEVI
jgi:tetratricopeptide (TPR) repeat protein